MRHPHQARFVCLLLLSAACAQWKAQSTPIPEVVASQPEQLLVTRHDGTSVILVDPEVVDSTLVGSLRTPRGTVRRDVTIEVAFSQISSVAIWDPGSPTLFKGFAFGLGALLAGVVIVCLTSECGS